MPEDMTVMIVDGGARGHVLSEAYEKDPRVKKIIVAPGNDFVGYNRGKEVVVAKDCSLKDPDSILAVARKHKPDLVDVAQDDALALGTVDLLTANGFHAFGPASKAARIESDKAWSRYFMLIHDIPSPTFRTFGRGLEESARAYVKSVYKSRPDAVLFTKAAGLCGGKGALRSDTLEDALYNIEAMKGFGDAGRSFLVEDGILRKDGSPGEEFSYTGISDGQTFLAFETAQDNKRELDGDRGGQTGGMGANSPAQVVAKMKDRIERRIMMPAIDGMIDEGNPFTGILYLGGMEADGSPIVVEFNARFGDPEIQTVLPGVRNYPRLVLAALAKKLDSEKVESDSKYRWCVVGASKGYPNDYSKVKGKEITGLQRAVQVTGVKIYGAGIAVRDERFYADGGRLFSVVGEGRTPLEAREKAYEAMSYVSIEGDGLHFRRDIGKRDIDRFLRDPASFQLS